MGVTGKPSMPHANGIDVGARTSSDSWRSGEAGPKHLSYNVVNPATTCRNWSLVPIVGVEVRLLQRPSCGL